jgi:hypothetical protein
VHRVEAARLQRSCETPHQCAPGSSLAILATVAETCHHETRAAGDQDVALSPAARPQESDSRAAALREHASCGQPPPAKPAKDQSDYGVV